MTFVATVLLPEAVARAVADRLHEDFRLSEASVDVFDAGNGIWRLAIYLPEAHGTDTNRALADSLRAAGDADSRFAVAELPETDWVAKSLAGLPPVRAGRFVVHGAHDRARLLPSDLSIEIEAGQAFGTGHHGTTTGCLLAIELAARTRRIRNALDIGTGSGVLAIAIAKRTRARVLASDIDPVAVRVAEDNVRLNGEAGRVRTLVATGLHHRLIRERAPYDLIVANILAGPLVALAPSIHRAVRPGGAIVLSGLLISQERRVAAVYRGLGLRQERALHLGEWATLVFGG